jgi:hypothetical protein
MVHYLISKQASVYNDLVAHTRLINIAYNMNAGRRQDTSLRDSATAPGTAATGSRQQHGTGITRRGRSTSLLTMR